MTGGQAKAIPLLATEAEKPSHGEKAFRSAMNDKQMEVKETQIRILLEILFREKFHLEEALTINSQEEPDTTSTGGMLAAKELGTQMECYKKQIRFIDEILYEVIETKKVDLLK